MGLTKLAISRPLTILMIILAIVILGLRAYTNLQVERTPNMDIAYVTITTQFPGASPSDVEELIVKPIEDAVAGAAGLDKITSQINEGVGIVTCSFKTGTNGDQAAIDIERMVSAVKSQLPTGAGEPSITKADMSATAILQVVLTGPQGKDTLAQYAKDTLKPRLESVTGVASVDIAGGRTEQVQVNVDAKRLAAYGLPLSTIQNSLSVNNLSYPLGSLTEGRKRSSLRSAGQFNQLEPGREPGNLAGG